jgi:N-methylhydantoinase B
VDEFSPLDFEVFRHALWEVNEEQGFVAVRTSGSPVVYEAYDMNTAVLDAGGNGLVSGGYVSLHSTTLDAVVRSVIETFGDDIHPGDLFITNDPWAGALHLNDFASVSPFFADGELLFWTGLVMHELDVGGPVPGGFAVGAREVWGEAPLIPPLRFVREGRLQPEIESLLLKNSRTPELNRLNLRVRVAAANIAAERLGRVVDKFGVKRVRSGQAQIVRHVAETLRVRLRSVPEGTWRERVWIDHDGVSDVSLRIQVAVTNRDGRLIFDFTGTDPQTAGGVNCTKSGLEGGVISTMFSMLCFDLPWSSAGVRGVIDIVTEEGTVNNASFPAAVSMASIFGSWMTSRVVNGALGKMLGCSDNLKKEAQAMWNPAFHGVTFAGVRENGSSVTILPLDQEAGGGGARSYADGIDAGSNIHSISNAIPNVERNEDVYPILQVWRRLVQDSGGPGKWRGGTGVEILYVPYGMRCPVEDFIFSSGDDQPGALGVHGGYPGAVQRHVILRGSALWRLFAEGFVPNAIQQISGATQEILPPKGRTTLGPNDAHWSFMAGGGGYGDPLERDIPLVESDVSESLVSREVAETVYGLANGGPDRAALRRRRLTDATPPNQQMGRVDPAALDAAHRLGEHVAVTRLGGRQATVCADCGQILGYLPADPKRGCACRKAALSSVTRLNTFAREDLFEFREYLCPGCGRLLGVHVAPRSEPELFEDTEIRALPEP